ncbi:uncharacterized protein CANTADRAFT_297738 [Suhomyces tanzawaensis NRRL Y-17324]|uniref:Uncharacterized protein n=1 Tax=Suhomyces tanzawaensis NRRL Y-17324 TaxID=984487 RepID=A0A1E4SF94_9ASCO|nr:uncharacterized protein CANTADRAFT_297738 [Suhomyces tanzawaensis NRRL Y-17324]ODV78136.1 hypothetical protein CANTADRAFT_297738 [Suhomyces tanzawaensis NRRL Y-17324]
MDTSSAKVAHHFQREFCTVDHLPPLEFPPVARFSTSVSSLHQRPGIPFVVFHLPPMVIPTSISHGALASSTAVFHQLLAFAPKLMYIAYITCATRTTADRAKTHTTSAILRPRFSNWCSSAPRS